MPRYTTANVKESLSQATADQSIVAMISGARISVTNGPDSFFNPDDKTIYIQENSTNALADFLHEQSHAQSNDQVQADVNALLRNGDAAGVYARCKEDEAQAETNAIFFLGQIPSNGSSGNALSTLGSNSQYIGNAAAITIFAQAAAQVGYRPGSTANLSQLKSAILNLVRQQISSTAGWGTAAAYIRAFNETRSLQNLPPLPYFNPQTGIEGPAPSSAPSPIPLPPPPPPPVVTIRVTNPSPVPPPAPGGGSGGGEPGGGGGAPKDPPKDPNEVNVVISRPFLEIDRQAALLVEAAAMLTDQSAASLHGNYLQPSPSFGLASPAT